MKRSQLEIFHDTVNHRSHDDILFYARLSPLIREKLSERLGIEISEIGNHYGMFQPQNVIADAKNKFSISEKPELLEYYKDIDIPDNAFFDFLGVLRIPSGMYHFFRRVSPLRNAESMKEFEQYPYPTADVFDLDSMKRVVKESHEKGLVTYCKVGHIYESSWQIRGYENFLMDMMLEPEKCEYILDRLCERNMKLAEMAAIAGVDYIHTGDDVANQRTLMFDIDMWRRFIKSRWARVYSAAKSIKPDIKIWYHSDGNISEIIPELIEIGVDILNPIQPECVDPIEIKQLYGEKIVLDGTIGTQTTLPFGTPEEVRELVRERKITLGQDGALIISPTHLVEPEVPIDNVIAFFEECGNFKQT